jgi:hypothetical protein
MRYGCLAALAGLLAGTGLAVAQPAATLPPGPTGASVEVGTGAAAELAVPGQGSAIVFAEAGEPPTRLWGAAEYLLWWLRDAPATWPLLTRGTASSLGVLGRPGTVVLDGGENYDYGTLSGGRIAAGVMDASGTIGIMGSGFLLEHALTGFQTTAQDQPAGTVLARPYINAVTQRSTSTIADEPLLITGFARTASARLWGAETNLVAAVEGDGYRLRGLLGFRYLDLYERLDDQELLFAPVFVFPRLTPGTRVIGTENFHTRNQFYGGQIGLDAEWRVGPFGVNLVSKLALGSTHQRVVIQGEQTVAFPTGVVTTDPEALLAGETNNSRTTSNLFAVVPELNVNVSLELARFVQLYVGYTFLYWSSIARPSDQIDPVVNPDFVFAGGPARPRKEFTHTDFWAQGINFGVLLRY